MAKKDDVIEVEATVLETLPNALHSHFTGGQGYG